MSWGRRRRSSYHSRWSNSPVTPIRQPKWTDATWKEQTQDVEFLVAHLTILERILRSKKALTWNSPREVAASLKFMLSMYRRKLELREQFLKAVRQVQSIIHTIMHGQLSHTASTHRGNGSEASVHADEFSMASSRPEDAIRAYELTMDWNELIERAKQDVIQLDTLLELPAYLTIKPHLRKIRNGIRAYSTILACQTGKEDKNLANEHKLFGWHETGYDAARIGKNLTWMSQNIWSEEEPPKKQAVARHRHRSRYRVSEREQVVEETREKVSRILPPSLVAGRDVFKQHLRDGEQPKKKLLERVMDIIQTRPYVPSTNPANTLGDSLFTRIDRALLAGNVSSITPCMLKRIIAKDSTLLRDAEIPKRIAMKIMRPQGRAEEDFRRTGNDVTTILTGPVERVMASDYRAPCIYNNGSATTEGYILMRKGYPDMVHISSMQPENLTQEAISRRLDTVTRRFFESQRSSNEPALSLNQRLARILKRCRALPALTREDSYSVGNCVPGTATFIVNLNLLIDDPDRKVVDGKTLAKQWRKQKFIQEYLFGNVVHHLYEKHQKERMTQDAASTALNHLVIEGALCALRYEEELALRREVDAMNHAAANAVEERLIEEALAPLSTGNFLIPVTPMNQETDDGDTAQHVEQSDARPGEELEGVRGVEEAIPLQLATSNVPDAEPTTRTDTPEHEGTPTYQDASDPTDHEARAGGGDQDSPDHGGDEADAAPVLDPEPSDVRAGELQPAS